MKILMFRPYKKLKDTELLNKIYETFEVIKLSSDYETMNLCDVLIREAKYRRLRCSKEMMYQKILFK